MNENVFPNIFALIRNVNKLHIYEFSYCIFHMKKQIETSLRIHKPDVILG